MIELQFTGRFILGFHKSFPTTCFVRNDENGLRLPHEVLYEKNGHVVKPGEGGRAYQPRRFPPGRWEITRAVTMLESSIYWPEFIETNAHQELEYWDLDGNGSYLKPSGETFDGEGYGVHHARVMKAGTPVVSRTTLGCLNVISPSDVIFLVGRIRLAWGDYEKVYINVPEWDEWER